MLEGRNLNKREVSSFLLIYLHALSFPHEKAKLGINNLKRNEKNQKSTYNKSVLNNVVSSTKSYRDGVTHTCGMPRLYI